MSLGDVGVAGAPVAFRMVKGGGIGRCPRNHSTGYEESAMFADAMFVVWCALAYVLAAATLAGLANACDGSARKNQ